MSRLFYLTGGSSDGRPGDGSFSGNFSYWEKVGEIIQLRPDLIDDAETRLKQGIPSHVAGRTDDVKMLSWGSVSTTGQTPAAACSDFDPLLFVLGTDTGGLHISYDGGQTVEPTACPIRFILDVACSNYDENVIYAVGDNGVAISVDKGRTWSRVLFPALFYADRTSEDNIGVVSLGSSSFVQGTGETVGAWSGPKLSFKFVRELKKVDNQDGSRTFVYYAATGHYRSHHTVANSLQRPDVETGARNKGRVYRIETTVHLDGRLTHKGACVLNLVRFPVDPVFGATYSGNNVSAPGSGVLRRNGWYSSTSSTIIATGLESLGGGPYVDLFTDFCGLDVHDILVFERSGHEVLVVCANNSRTNVMGIVGSGAGTPPVDLSAGWLGDSESEQTWLRPFGVGGLFVGVRTNARFDDYQEWRWTWYSRRDTQTSLGIGGSYPMQRGVATAHRFTTYEDPYPPNRFGYTTHASFSSSSVHSVVLAPSDGNGNVPVRIGTAEGVNLVNQSYSNSFSNSFTPPVTGFAVSPSNYLEIDITRRAYGESGTVVGMPCTLLIAYMTPFSDPVELRITIRRGADVFEMNISLPGTSLAARVVPVKIRWLHKSDHNLSELDTNSVRLTNVGTGDVYINWFGIASGAIPTNIVPKSTSVLNETPWSSPSFPKEDGGVEPHRTWWYHNYSYTLDGLPIGGDFYVYWSQIHLAPLPYVPVEDVYSMSGYYSSAWVDYPWGRPTLTAVSESVSYKGTAYSYDSSGAYLGCNGGIFRAKFILDSDGYPILDSSERVFNRPYTTNNISCSSYTRLITNGMYFLTNGFAKFFVNREPVRGHPPGTLIVTDSENFIVRQSTYGLVGIIWRPGDTDWRSQQTFYHYVPYNNSRVSFQKVLYGSANSQRISLVGSLAGDASPLSSDSFVVPSDPNTSYYWVHLPTRSWPVSVSEEIASVESNIYCLSRGRLFFRMNYPYLVLDNVFDFVSDEGNDSVLVEPFPTTNTELDDMISNAGRVVANAEDLGRGLRRLIWETQSLRVKRGCFAVDKKRLADLGTGNHAFRVANRRFFAGDVPAVEHGLRFDLPQHTSSFYYPLVDGYDIQIDPEEARQMRTWFPVRFIGGELPPPERWNDGLTYRGVRINGVCGLDHLGGGIYLVGGLDKNMASVEPVPKGWKVGPYSPNRFCYYVRPTIFCIDNLPNLGYFPSPDNPDWKPSDVTGVFVLDKEKTIFLSIYNDDASSNVSMGYESNIGTRADLIVRDRNLTSPPFYPACWVWYDGLDREFPWKAWSKRLRPWPFCVFVSSKGNSQRLIYKTGVRGGWYSFYLYGLTYGRSFEYHGAYLRSDSSGLTTGGVLVDRGNSMSWSHRMAAFERVTGDILSDPDKFAVWYIRNRPENLYRVKIRSVDVGGRVRLCLGQFAGETRKWKLVDGEWKIDYGGDYNPVTNKNNMFRTHYGDGGFWPFVKLEDPSVVPGSAKHGDARMHTNRKITLSEIINGNTAIIYAEEGIPIGEEQQTYVVRCQTALSVGAGENLTIEVGYYATDTGAFVSLGTLRNQSDVGTILPLAAIDGNRRVAVRLTRTVNNFSSGVSNNFTIHRQPKPVGFPIIAIKLPSGNYYLPYLFNSPSQDADVLMQVDMTHANINEPDTGFDWGKVVVPPNHYLVRNAEIVLEPLIWSGLPKGFAIGSPSHANLYVPYTKIATPVLYDGDGNPIASAALRNEVGSSGPGDPPSGSLVKYVRMDQIPLGLATIDSTTTSSVFGARLLGSYYTTSTSYNWVGLYSTTASGGSVHVVGDGSPYKIEDLFLTYGSQWMPSSPPADNGEQATLDIRFSRYIGTDNTSSADVSLDAVPTPYYVWGSGNDRHDVCGTLLFRRFGDFLGEGNHARIFIKNKNSSWSFVKHGLLASISLKQPLPTSAEIDRWSDITRAVIYHTQISGLRRQMSYDNSMHFGVFPGEGFGGKDRLLFTSLFYRANHGIVWESVDGGENWYCIYPDGYFGIPFRGYQFETDNTLVPIDQFDAVVRPFIFVSTDRFNSSNAHLNHQLPFTRVDVRASPTVYYGLEVGNDTHQVLAGVSENRFFFARDKIYVAQTRMTGLPSLFVGAHIFSPNRLRTSFFSGVLRIDLKPVSECYTLSNGVPVPYGWRSVMRRLNTVRRLYDNVRMETSGPTYTLYYRNGVGKASMSQKPAGRFLLSVPNLYPHAGINGSSHAIQAPNIRTPVGCVSLFYSTGGYVRYNSESDGFETLTYLTNRAPSISLLVSPVDSNVVYAAVSSAWGTFDDNLTGSVLMKSKDGGVTWHVCNGVKMSNCRFDSVLLEDPLKPYRFFITSDPMGLVLLEDEELKMRCDDVGS